MDLPEGFDTATFGGYNKKSVLRYFDDIKKKEKMAQEEHAKQLAQKDAESRGLLERIQTLEAAASKILEHKTALENTIVELRQELERQRGVAAQYEQQLREQEESRRQLMSHSENLDSKSKKYDEAMAQIGGAFMEARRGADKILKDAEVKAEQITQQAKESVRGLVIRVGGFKQDIGTLRQTMQGTLSEMTRRLNELDQSIDKLCTSVEVQVSGNAPEFVANQEEPEQAWGDEALERVWEEIAPETEYTQVQKAEAEKTEAVPPTVFGAATSFTMPGAFSTPEPADQNTFMMTTTGAEEAKPAEEAEVFSGTVEYLDADEFEDAPPAVPKKPATEQQTTEEKPKFFW